MKKLTCRSWGVSNAYKVEKTQSVNPGLDQLFQNRKHERVLCEKLDRRIRYRLRLCIWKHWKDSEKQSKKPDEAGCTTLGSV